MGAKDAIRHVPNNIPTKSKIVRTSPFDLFANARLPPFFGRQLEFLAAEQSRLAEAKAERDQQDLVVAQREREARELFVKADKARREVRDRMRKVQTTTRPAS
eukprot:251107-Prorocentrum_minimum.AAC.1